MAKESKKESATEPTNAPETITLTNFSLGVANAPSFNCRLLTPYQIAKRIALGIFAEHKFYRYEAIEGGLLGTCADGKKALFPRDTLESLVLSCMTDLVLRELPSEMETHVQRYDADLRYNAKNEKDQHAREEMERTKLLLEEAGKPLHAIQEKIDAIKGELKSIPPMIEANKRECNLLTQQGKTEFCEGQLAPPPESLQYHLDNIEKLQERYIKLEEELSAEKAKFETAHERVCQASAKYEKAKKEYNPSP